MFTSLAPGFVAGALHHPSRLLAGVTVFLVFGAAAVSQVAGVRMRPGARFAAGLAAEASGLVMAAADVGVASLALFLIGGAVAGAGAGTLFKSAVGTVAAMAPPALRGEALSGLFLIAYTGMSIPSVGMGIATQFVAVTTAMAWFTGVTVALLAAIAVLLARSHAAGPRSAQAG